MCEWIRREDVEIGLAVEIRREKKKEKKEGKSKRKKERKIGGKGK
jgi:hypothetical protein